MRTSLGALGLCLIGYALFGKTFAYIGVSPLFVGEAVIGVLIFSFFAFGAYAWLPKRPIIVFIVLFMSWGAIRTFPGVSQYGLDALRDGVVWGYGIVALLVSALLLRTGLVYETISRSASIFPWFCVIMPVNLIIYQVFQGSLPNIPGTETPILFTKAGDVGVHIAGCISMIMLGIPYIINKKYTFSYLPKFILYGSIIVGIISVASINRGGFLSIFMAVLVVSLLSPNIKMSTTIMCGAIVVFVLAVLGIESGVAGSRSISIGQFVENILSIVGLSNNSYYLDATVAWRITWWNRIIDYTVFGDYFWIGKGFGVNLAVEDFIEAYLFGTDLRSPHNAHMTILGRAGVPGLLLWVAINVSFVYGIMSCYYRSIQHGLVLLSKVNVWLLAYWAAFVVNMSFDVYLEGPQGGIWFWSVIGAGIAFAEHQRRMFASPEFTARPPAAHAAAAAE